MTINKTEEKTEQKFYDGAHSEILNTETDHDRSQNRYERY